MNSNDKLRPLYILQALMDRTDENNYITTAQLCDILKNEHELDTHRKTISNDIALLRKAKYPIEVHRGTQNQYKFVKRNISVPELKTVIDAVASAKFIPETESRLLINKLEGLTSANNAKNLERHVVAQGRRKSGDEQIFEVIDIINEAITKNKRIRFKKTEYNIKKERILHRGGEEYTFSPYSLVWDGDNYYMVGYSDKYKSIGNHRVDRIAGKPEILKKAAVEKPEGFKIADYLNSSMKMSVAPVRDVELYCDNSVIDAIVDKFGTGVHVMNKGVDAFTIKQNVAVGKVFYAWVFGFEGKVRILAPADVKKEFKEMMNKVSKSIT